MKLLSGAILSVALAGVAAAQGDGMFAGEVTASRLKLRAGPGEAYQPVVTVNRGAKLVVLGRHGNSPDWVMVEVPGGYAAWVSGRFVEAGADGRGTITGDRLLVRPTASTTYHQLAGRLNRGETVEIVGRETTKEGVWYQVKVPARIPLFAHSRYLKNVGPPSVARAATAEAAPAAAGDTASAGAADGPGPRTTKHDERFLEIEGRVRDDMEKAAVSGDFEPLKRAVAEIDRSRLSIENRERRVKLLADILDRERTVVVEELKRREDQVKEDLEARLEEIERNYRKRLAEIEAEHERERKPRYTATGIVEWSPDIVGRVPSYRISEGGKMKYFLIATQFDLGKFVGKRVGVVGIRDPESGTGFETIMIRRIEILGDR